MHRHWTRYSAAEVSELVCIILPIPGADYADYLPPHSYLDIRKLGVRKLARVLLELDADDVAYER